MLLLSLYLHVVFLPMANVQNRDGMTIHGVVVMVQHRTMVLVPIWFNKVNNSSILMVRGIDILHSPLGPSNFAFSSSVGCSSLDSPASLEADVMFARNDLLDPGRAVRDVPSKLGAAFTFISVLMGVGFAIQQYEENNEATTRGLSTYTQGHT